ncbi:class I SAM-dependent methyltransferase [Micromonospora sp. NPDC023644]|uniref:class I SAM-dependent methyltransferase n=1 Tax=Micromonospora sp. NPDC023644 TaxID=3154321 RepID=UPI0033E06696
MADSCLDRLTGMASRHPDGDDDAHPYDVRYEASRWASLTRVVPWSTVGRGDVFVDFGCGRGRALYVASWYRFGEVIGVEKSADLAEAARRNLGRARGPARLRRARVVTARVEDFDIPDSLTVGFLFNPFHGPVFDDLCARLADSARRRPRRLRIVYANPVEGDRLVAHGFEPTRSARKLALYEWRPEASRPQ